MASSAQLKRQLLVLLAQRRAAELAGDPPKIWQFGVMTHPFETREYQDEIEDIVRWMGEFVDDGDAQWASDRDVAEELDAWDLDYPTTSSFTFAFEDWLAGSDEPYPYRSEGITEGLYDGEVVDEISVDGATGFSLLHREVQRGPMDVEGVRVYTIGEADLALYTFWADGDPVTLDVSAWLSAGATSMAADGTTAVIDPTALEVDGLGVVVTDDPSIWDTL